MQFFAPIPSHTAKNKSDLRIASPTSTISIKTSCNKLATFQKSHNLSKRTKIMASSSLTFSGAASSEIAAASTYRRAMSKEASRHLYNYRLNTPEPQQSHHRKSTRTHPTAFTQNHHASRQLTTAITPPRRHPGVELPEASASQHQAIYLEYLDLVAAGKITDPVSPPDYRGYGIRDGDGDEEEVPEFAPPSYEQVLEENDGYEDASRGRRSRGRDEERRRRRRGMMTYRHQSPRTQHTPAIQELQLIRITTPFPTTLPPRPKSVNFFSRLGDKFRVSRAG